MRLLNVVTLTVDWPKKNLRRGQIGTVVEILTDGAAFDVEFSESLSADITVRNDRTYHSLGSRPEQIMHLHFEQVSSDEAVELAIA